MFAHFLSFVHIGCSQLSHYLQLLTTYYILQLMEVLTTTSAEHHAQDHESDLEISELMHSAKMASSKPLTVATGFSHIHGLSAVCPDPEFSQMLAKRQPKLTRREVLLRCLRALFCGL